MRHRCNKRRFLHSFLQPATVEAQHSGHSAAGFTLAELLVVVFIISMLWAITLPVLTRSMRSGDRVTCASNQRQLYLGWTMYAMANKGYLMSADTQFNVGADDDNWVCDGPIPWLKPEPDRNTIGGTETAIKGGHGTVIYLGVDYGDANTNCGALWPYIKDVRVYRCPAAKYTRGYSISAAMNGGEPSYKKLDEVKTSYSKAVFIDAAPQWVLCSDGQLYLFWQGGPFTTICNQLSAKHEKGCNILFADGHNQYRKWQDSTVGFIDNGGTGPRSNDQDFLWLDEAFTASK